MRNNIWTIMRKEFARFFGDKRMIITTLLLPGILIYIMYSFMGSALTSSTTTDEKYVYKVSVSNMPDSVSLLLKDMKFDINNIKESETDKIKSKVQEEKVDMLVIFPANFDALVANYDKSDLSQTPPNILIYYNSLSPGSSGAYAIMISVLNNYESLLANKFDINKDQGTYDLASEKDITGELFSMMLPMLMMIFMFSGCMAIAPESIAGEKERGTIATLLVTPIKRSELAIGKILSLSVIALLAGLSSFIGTMLSLPKLMGAGIEDMKASFYSISDYILLLLVILSTVLVIISLISIISAFAKSVKEATTAVMPLMIVVMLIGITSMFGDGAKEYFAWYLIPLYNSVQCMNGIFSFHYNAGNILISLISNIVVVGILMFVLTRIFKSEKIMFSR